MSYSLEALLKLREHKKNLAEHSLKDALLIHEQEKNKLQKIRLSLQEVTCHRTQNEDNFYNKSQVSPFNKREIICHASYGKKTIVTEADLKNYIKEQEGTVNISSAKLNLAKSTLMNAHQDLKIIEKHYESWHKKKKLSEQKKSDDQSDDLNQTRFILRKIKP
jgi:hypothetical protein